MNTNYSTLLEIINHILNKHPELADIISETAKQKIQKKPDDIQKIFTGIYNGNLWGSSESASGAGSEYVYTKNLREKLPDLISKYNINKILDAPCGDFNWMRFVIEQVQVDYVGADIVQEIITVNNAKYESKTVNFLTLDITVSPLPSADLIICRDCLFHLSFNNISKFIANFLKSNINYILTTSHYSEFVDTNKDIIDGGFRLIDLFAEPFNFPSTPLEQIEDWIPGYPPRRMILWSRRQLIEKFSRAN
jgi:hypothetical protein